MFFLNAYDTVIKNGRAMCDGAQFCTPRNRERRPAVGPDILCAPQKILVPTDSRFPPHQQPQEHDVQKNADPASDGPGRGGAATHVTMTCNYIDMFTRERPRRRRVLPLFLLLRPVPLPLTPWVHAAVPAPPRHAVRLAALAPSRPCSSDFPVSGSSCHSVTTLRSVVPPYGL